MPDGLNRPDRPDRPAECPECNCRILAPMGNGWYRCTNKACWIVFEWPNTVGPVAANGPQSLQDSITGPSKASDEVSSVSDKRMPHIEFDNLKICFCTLCNHNTAYGHCYFCGCGNHQLEPPLDGEAVKLRTTVEHLKKLIRSQARKP